MSARDDGLTHAAEVARRLAGSGSAQISRRLTGGGNSRVWHVQDGDREFALKQYPSRRDDPRDRLSTEVSALRLMAKCRIDAVPRVIDVDVERGYALLSWIDGRAITDVSDGDIDAAAAFLAAVHALRTSPGAAQQPLAAEACLSGREIERQIDERIAKLDSIAGGDSELVDFIGHSVAPAFAQVVKDARRSMTSAKLDFAAELPQEWRSLVPSDFGFHNSLRRSDGTLAFIDFEYFGWDDPVKLTAEVLLHPGRSVPAPQRKRFRRAVERFYGSDPAFAHRLSSYLPLFGLRWVLILLNEFIPERWERRVLAGEAGSWSEAKSRQLAKARSFLAALPDKVGG